MRDRIPLSLKVIFAFTTLGLAFSGYLLLSDLFLGSKALSETTQLFLGLPAFCYGLILFVSLLTLSFYIHKKNIIFDRGIVSLTGVSFLGIIFSIYLTFIELPNLLSKGFASYTFGLPTSFIDLIFFMLIFVTSAIAWSYERDHNR